MSKYRILEKPVDVFNIQKDEGRLVPSAYWPVWQEEWRHVEKHKTLIEAMYRLHILRACNEGVVHDEKTI